MSRHWFGATPDADGRAVAGSSRRVRQVVVGLPPVPSLDTVRAWEDIPDALNHAGIAPDKLQMVGSTVIRAHHPLPDSRLPANDEREAAGAEGGLRKRPLAAQKTGSRPGSRVNGAGLPVRAGITPGQDADYTGYDLVMADNLPQPSVLVADKGYDSDKVREDVESRDALSVIPMRKNRKVRKTVDMTIYTLRNMVERCFNRLKNSRRLATRYDKTADSFPRVMTH